MKLFRREWWWDWYDWSLSYLTERTDRHSEWKSVFCLKCSQCLRFTFGCSEHWFCGSCEPCKVVSESEDEPDEDCSLQG